MRLLSDDFFKLSFYSAIFFFIVFLGASFNVTAVEGNSCRMPVKSQSFINTDTHFAFIENWEVEYWYFSDIFKLRLPNHYLYYSIGDVLIVVGILYYIYLLCCIVNYKNKLKHYNKYGES